jgi:hypothetical protein
MFDINTVLPYVKKNPRIFWACGWFSSYELINDFGHTSTIVDLLLQIEFDDAGVICTGMNHHHSTNVLSTHSTIRVFFMGFELISFEQSIGVERYIIHGN